MISRCFGCKTQARKYVAPLIKVPVALRLRANLKSVRRALNISAGDKVLSRASLSAYAMPAKNKIIGVGAFAR